MKDPYETSLLTGEVQLKFWNKITHYGIVIYIAVIPAIFLFFNLKSFFLGDPFVIKQLEVWALLISCGLGLLFYLIQKSRLRFKIIDTTLTNEELLYVINQVGKENEWTIPSVYQKIITAKTNPGFLSGSWGEQITILIDNNKVLVNSICDPDQMSSVVSFGRNKKNVNALLEGILNHSKHQ